MVLWVKGWDGGEVGCVCVGVVITKARKSNVWSSPLPAVTMQKGTLLSCVPEWIPHNTSESVASAALQEQE